MRLEASTCPAFFTPCLKTDVKVDWVNVRSRRSSRPAHCKRWATNVVDAMLAVVHKQRVPDIKRIDTPQGSCPILEQLHAEGVWRSEEYSATRAEVFILASTLNVI